MMLLLHILMSEKVHKDHSTVEKTLIVLSIKNDGKDLALALHPHNIFHREKTEDCWLIIPDTGLRIYLFYYTP